MAPAAWAYQVENFDPPPDEELVCSVCRGIFCDPIQSPCNHVFCRGCLLKWLERGNRNCPICRKRTTRSSIQEVVPLIKNMIMKLTLRCRNSDNGCKEKFTLEACDSHIRTCMYEMMQCRNKPCVKMFPRKDIGEHELKNCPHRNVRCLNCACKVPPSKLKHDCIAALQQKVNARTEELKEKTKRIEELENELKKMTDASRALSSDLSSLGSVSAADVLIDLDDMSALSTASSVSDDSNSYFSDADDFVTQYFDLDVNETPQRRDCVLGIMLNDDHHNDDSIEFPRASSHEPLDFGSFLGIDDLESTMDEEPKGRRPIKRRHPALTLDSTDEDNDGSNEMNLDLPSLPSPKRSWNLFQRDNVRTRPNLPESSAQGSSDCATAGPSHATSDIEESHTSEDNPELSNASVKIVSPTSRQRRSKKRANKHKVLPTTLTCAQRNSSPVFERTLAMLEQYNLESDDPEWLPMDSSRSVTTTRNRFSFLNDCPTSSEESNVSDSSDSSSDNSSVTDEMLSRWAGSIIGSSTLRRLYGSSSDDDPDWSPPSILDKNN